MLVIHIGPRKTGTTYLQNSFHRHRRLLLKRGWLYPQMSLHVQSAHHELVAAKDGLLARTGAMYHRLNRAASKARKLGANLLVSSESFRRWTPDDMRMLGDLTGHDRVLIVYTLRDPVGRLPSLWGENVKNGRRQALPAYLDKHLANPMASHDVNPLVELQPIIDHPELELLVLNYEAIRGGGDDLYQAFCREVLGISDLGIARHDPANSSFSNETNTYLRLLSRHISFDPVGRTMMFARLFERSHTDGEIAEIEDLIRVQGSQWLKVRRIERGASWFAALDRALLDGLSPSLRPAPAGDRLFTDKPLDISYYEGDLLSKVPEIAEWLDRSAERLATKRYFWRRTRAQEYWRRLKRLFVI